MFKKGVGGILSPAGAEACVSDPHGTEGSAQFSVSRTVAGSITVLSLQGELDLHTAGLLRHAIVADPAGCLNRVVIDLQLVTFMDSSGLAILIDFHRTIRNVSGWLRLAGIPSCLQHVFEFKGFDGFFDCYPSVQHALTA
ncbi:STAS domain-containing protein [Streptomyces minutiscleroticus]|uniref:STAS domain-containing protein n=1 Tax=Streptomyces minutiscleroticus TaxID=68238 RepID=UPI001E2F1337|nr:STAS domain-containing protein [Streptomyces minutiscleroticus]